MSKAKTNLEGTVSRSLYSSGFIVWYCGLVLNTQNNDESIKKLNTKKYQRCNTFKFKVKLKRFAKDYLQFRHEWISWFVNTLLPELFPPNIRSLLKAIFSRFLNVGFLDWYRTHTWTVGFSAPVLGFSKKTRTRNVFRTMICPQKFPVPVPYFIFKKISVPDTFSIPNKKKLSVYLTPSVPYLGTEYGTGMESVPVLRSMMETSKIHKSKN